MSYDEEHARKSRVVVETPTERREVVQSQEVRTPDRSGVSAGMVGVLVVVAIALITILVLFWMSSQPTTDPNANLTAQQQPPTTIVQQPAQQPPVIIQQPAPVTHNQLRSLFHLAHRLAGAPLCRQTKMRRFRLR